MTEPIILRETYTIFELPADSTHEQFQMMITSYQEKGYVIPGVITDYANGKIVIVARKPTKAERDAMNTPPDMTSDDSTEATR